eukprot:767971-Hanusia_phi.AAC.5
MSLTCKAYPTSQLTLMALSKYVYEASALEFKAGVKRLHCSAERHSYRTCVALHLMLTDETPAME